MTSKKPIQDSLKEYGRGITGGLLFSLPMLYTMELWWAGFIANTMQLVLYFIIGIGLLMLYNRYVGIRRDNAFVECLLESFEEMGLAIILTIFILWITGRISNVMSLSEISGKVIVEAITVAIGISVGKSQLGSEEKDKEKEEEKQKETEKSQRPDLIREISIALCGTILIASNVAPTEEVIVIAMESEVYKIFIIALLSIGIGGSVLYYINFTGTEQMIAKPGQHGKALAGTLIMYAIALSSSAFMLWFFGRFAGLELGGVLAQTVVLGFPATLGASAGRLLIQT
ncbi:TIGR02587 family membrane protein [Gelidibacter gilvus]|uniref:TIGR02587 family membrane protein n=1 Tax=Gelidibacter gilvus TaxID=59602 RepID=A0A4V1LMF2_9FLAO|nr:TIGR02587 family membrane protein [Gelidibacter gilvus]RXJ44349.1 TIGR02587 family membrane protein [Gelidibacter gilvus]